MKHSSLCLLSALGGAVVGATIAMLVTPQSGPELRGKIRNAFGEMSSKMRGAACNCTDENAHCADQE